MLISAQGTKTVGNASGIPLAQRVQLAVVAHIRHVYTEYDQLLRMKAVYSRPKARAKVQKQCLEQLVKWRGEGDDGTADIEEILREVIVISDDEDDDDIVDDEGVADRLRRVRDSSIEFVSSQVRANGIEGGRGDRGPEERAVYDGQHLTAVPLAATAEQANQRQQEADQRAREKFQRRGFNRYRIWNEALEQYRKQPRQPNESVQLVPVNPTSHHSERPRLVYSDRFVLLDHFKGFVGV